MFSNTECMFKDNLFFLANTQNPDQAQHQLQYDYTSSYFPSWWAGVKERYLPTNAILNLYGGTFRQRTGKQCCRTCCAYKRNKPNL